MKVTKEEEGEGYAGGVQFRNTLVPMANNSYGVSTYRVVVNIVVGDLDRGIGAAVSFRV